MNQEAEQQDHQPDDKHICPVCRGDGGVNGGCIGCDGSGWVTPDKAKSGVTMLYNKPRGGRLE